MVSADVTSFVPPPEAPPSCPDDDFATFRVYAFNAQGLSGPAIWGIVVECGRPIVTATVAPGSAVPATATPPAVLPDTGGVADGHTSAVALWPLVAAGAAALLGAGALAFRRS